ncbi:hypothetical protein Rhal01_00803 [Rubritalea halochordaticola]|uniref:4Fe-4S ferredoxin-type domain-containing protein n=1 Tax=Rubritalea halochordaticola TaxID=714537 RepID=A0ABP9UW54_9BACT
MSKRKWHHPEVPAGERVTKVWRSAGELEDTPALRQWVDREFPRAAESMRDEDDRESTRRDFLKVMGASTALAGFGLAACRRPVDLIVPFVDAPEWVIPGKPLYYASSMPSAGGATPLMVTTYEGRPTKLEPNRIHTEGGGTDSFVQASVLDLYDPARSRDFLSKGSKISRDEAIKNLSGLVKSGKVGFVFGEDDSATRTRLRKDLAAKYTGAKFYSYEALAGQGRKASVEATFGSGAEVVTDFTKAKRILSVDCDFLELDRQGSVKGFYDLRHVNGRDYSKDAVANAGNMNRLYMAEPTYSLTGGLADHRAPLAPSQVGRFLAQVAQELGVAVDNIPGGKFDGDKAKWIAECVKDLKSARGEAVVLLGSRYAKELHDLAFLINQKLGAYGKTLKAVQTEKAGLGDVAGLVRDIDAGNLDTVILLTPANPLLENPTVELSDSKKVSLADALGKVKVVQWGTSLNATANAADLHIPAAHYLESWGDTYSSTGVYTVVQPMILPLYGGITELELLSGLLADQVELHDSMADAKAVSPGYYAVRKTFKGISKASGERAEVASFKKLLREGFLADSSYSDITGGAKQVSVPALKEVSAPTEKGLDIIFQTDASLKDGRYINNAWLQEAPDPVSKVCWDNALYMSPETAKNLGIYEELVKLEKASQAWWGFGSDIKKTDVPEEGEGPSLYAPMASVTVNGKELEAPVIVSFGMADNVVAVALGYGQAYDQHFGDQFKGGNPSFYDGSAITPQNVSSVGVNTGFDAYPLRGTSDYFTTGAVVSRSKSGNTYKMARTQEHHSMYGRAIAREISTMDDEYGGHKTDFAGQLKKVQKQGMDSHAPENISLYKPEGAKDPNDPDKRLPHLSDKSHQWAMSIDLSVCNGCNACLVACQAENNIPVVGKTQVAMGREMHWIRMDRYFAAPDEKKAEGKDEWLTAPEMIPQPVACVQCESAPCETVCPVNATVHTEDGLNSMAYNRCIGTRYCANNCPYKARRFNFFDYNKRNPVIHKNLYKGPLGEKQVGDSKHLQRNPNVSVRMRGVMEKCTYCVQRLQTAKIEAKQNTKKKALAGAGSVNTEVSPQDLMSKTDAVRVACQDACEAGAIVFGNLLDPKSTIRRIKDENNKIINDRAYDLLNYIGTRPRTSYLARVKNPNQDMPGAKLVGRATIHMH